MDTEELEIQKTAEVAVASPTPHDLIAMAIDKGMDIDQLQKLMDMQERWEKKEAKKSFLDAMCEFQRNCPELTKDKEVKYSGTSYWHASLGSITGQIKAPLANAGLSFRFESESSTEGLKMACIVSHLDGHSESFTMSAANDKSGSKNAIQAIGSTMTYLQRYTLIGALGLSTAEDDNDGATTEPAPSQSRLNQLKAEIGELLDGDQSEDAAYIRQMCKEKSAAFEFTVTFAEEVVANIKGGKPYDGQSF